MFQTVRGCVLSCYSRFAMNECSDGNTLDESDWARQIEISGKSSYSYFPAYGGPRWFAMVFGQ
jgi:hypothetical protein